MNKEPWLLPYTPWRTQAEFYTYIRGGLRKSVWARHPVKIAYLNKHRFKAPIGKPTKSNPSGLVWACKCELCGETFRQTECEVDHLDPAGSLRTEDDLKLFITKLAFVDFDDLRILDKTCHRAVSYSDRMGISFEEAVLEKKVIAFSKLPIGEQNDTLTSLDVSPLPTNAKTRKEAYRTHLKSLT